jgi:hypothetical protein
MPELEVNTWVPPPTLKEPLAPPNVIPNDPVEFVPVNVPPERLNWALVPARLIVGTAALDTTPLNAPVLEIVKVALLPVMLIPGAEVAVALILAMVKVPPETAKADEAPDKVSVELVGVTAAAIWRFIITKDPADCVKLPVMFRAKAGLLVAAVPFDINTEGDPVDWL